MKKGVKGSKEQLLVKNAISEKCYLLFRTLIKIDCAPYLDGGIVSPFFYRCSETEQIDARLEDDNQQTRENALRRW